MAEGDVIVEPERRTNVYADVDVVVVGGGTAGAVAAIASARTGASTVLVERFGSLGGCPTIGRCAHIANQFVDSRRRRTVSGITLEIMERLAESGGMPHSNLEDAFMGKDGIGMAYLPVDPEILGMVIMEMVAESGVNLMMHTYFCDAVMEGGSMRGITVQNKAGRQAVLAGTIVDATGEADVAYSAGAPCISPKYQLGFGLLVRLGNVELQKFLDYFLSLDAGKENPEFTQWFCSHIGMPIDEIRNDRYLRMFIDPQSYEGCPVGREFTPEVQKWFKDKWDVEGHFAYINTHVFRDLFRKAVENGDFNLRPKIGDFGEIRFNIDGFTGGLWRKNEILMNVISTNPGLDAFDSTKASQIELAARKWAFKLAKFLKAYMPGFGDSYVLDMGAQTMPRHAREIRGESALTRLEGEKKRELQDAVCLIGRRGGAAFQIPYRIMLPEQIEKLLVTGKCVAGGVGLRVIPSCMAMGQAAGTAAALASKSKLTPRQLDIRLLQKELERQSVLLHLSS